MTDRREPLDDDALRGVAVRQVDAFVDEICKRYGLEPKEIPRALTLS